MLPEAGLTGGCYHTQLLLVDMVSCKLLAQASLMLKIQLTGFPRITGMSRTTPS
jgi:hypothetical protein